MDGHEEVHIPYCFYSRELVETTVFLTSKELQRELRKMLKQSSEAKLAVAYWGDGARKILDINPRKKGIKIICDLEQGRSSPDEIAPFGTNARRLANLHAKVYWTPSRAIVSSANASSNGLGTENAASSGLVEAGVVVEDKQALIDIRKWFDDLWSESKTITKFDLDVAAAARLARGMASRNGRSGTSRKRRSARALPSLIDHLAQAPKSNARKHILLAFYWDKLSREANKAFSSFKKSASAQKWSVKSKYYGCYENWNVPRNKVIIDCNLTTREIDVCFVPSAPVILGFDYGDGTRGNGVVCEKASVLNFPFRLSSDDKSRILRCSKNLWKHPKAIGDSDARIVRFDDARRVLLRKA